MLKTGRNLKSLSGLLMLVLAFILICSTLLFMLDVPSYAEENASGDNTGITGLADDGHDHDHDTEETEKEKTPFQKWWASYNQIIGYIVAVIIAIAIGVTIFLWIPKEDKKAKNKNKRN